LRHISSRAFRAATDPFGAGNCGNDCHTIARQPEPIDLARIFGGPLAGRPEADGI